jgi:alkylation response protein AidB-like acyl-CoA dehydrogenase
MTIDRAELQDAVRKAFGESGLVPDAVTSWDQFVEMGFLGLTVPEGKGGLGLGPEALAAVHYELGRTLVPGPMIAQMLVIEALAGHADLRVQAVAGQKMTVGHFACDADLASHILVGGSERISLISRDAASITPQVTWDETRRLFSVESNAKGSIIAEGEAARALAERLKKNLCLMLAADSLGGANAVFELTVEYLKTRRQFDRPLAMFQALKHRCADLKIALVAAEALLWSRANDADASLADFGALKAHACAVFRTTAEEAIQLHGGIGLTAEHPCHLFLKRAMLNGALGGDGDYWEECAGRNALERQKIS